MTTENISFRLQSLANAEVRRRLPMRAKVQVAPAARLRPQQRLRGRLHGLVPLSLLLLLPVRRTRTKYSVFVSLGHRNFAKDFAGSSYWCTGWTVTSQTYTLSGPVMLLQRPWIECMFARWWPTLYWDAKKCLFFHWMYAHQCLMGLKYKKLRGYKFIP